MSKQAVKSAGREATVSRIEYVPYARLCLSPRNVRRKSPTGIEPLAETYAEYAVMRSAPIGTRVQLLFTRIAQHYLAATVMIFLLLFRRR